MRPSQTEYHPLEVKLKRDESGEHLIKRFMKKVRAEEVIPDFLSHRYFEKPSVKRRKKRLTAIYLSQFDLTGKENGDLTSKFNKKGKNKKRK